MGQLTAGTLVGTRSLWHKAALCISGRRHDLVCITGASARELRAGRHQARSSRAHRLLSMGPYTGAVFLVGGHQDVPRWACAARQGRTYATGAKTFYAN